MVSKFYIQFLSQSNIFRKAITVKQRVMAGYRMPKPETMPESVAAIMERCWAQGPKKQPTAADLRQELAAINKVSF